MDVVSHRSPSASAYPRVPVSCGAILLDGQRHLLIVKPTYKSGWSIPGGSMEPNGETPWQACQREVFEETGLRVSRGRLVAVDSRPAKGVQPLRVRMLFHCGLIPGEDVATIRLPRQELSEWRFEPVETALEMLRPPIARRVQAGLTGRGCVYLEDGRPAPGILY